MAPVIEIRVLRRFPGGGSVDVALELPLDPPRTTVLFGPSGAGKTTLLRCIAGLDRPQDGRLRLGRETWYDASGGVWVPATRRRVGFLHQEPALFPHLDVAANVAYGLPRGSDPGGLLEAFGLRELACRRPAGLSGGQRQRVALARTLAPGPRLLLLDEPLSALDAGAREGLGRELRRWLRRAGIPAVVVTHDRVEAQALGDDLVLMAGGRVLQQGPVDLVFRRPAGAEAARLLGVETVLDARLVRRDGGLAEVEVGGRVLVAVDRGLAPGPVRVCIRAEDVVLRPGRPGADSARNHLPARIDALHPQGPLVRVELACGMPLVALVTPRSVEDLGLREGGSVTAVFKAPAVHLVP